VSQDLLCIFFIFKKSLILSFEMFYGLVVDHYGIIRIQKIG